MTIILCLKISAIEICVASTLGVSLNFASGSQEDREDFHSIDIYHLSSKRLLFEDTTLGWPWLIKYCMDHLTLSS